MEQGRVLIRAELKNDTAPGGIQNNDGVTCDPTIVGTLGLHHNVHQLKARFHGSQFFTDITSVVQTDGSFVLDLAELERILEGRLEDGSYALRLEAEDRYGTTIGSTDIAFTLDTTSPVPVLFEPPSGGVTHLQLGFIDVAIFDASEIDHGSIDPEDIIIRNENITLNVVRAEPTSDGLFRYYYEGELTEGLVTVTFVQGQISDIAGNTNAQEIQSFEFFSSQPALNAIPQRAQFESLEFQSPPPTLNGVPQRPKRLGIEPNINPPYNEDSGGSVYLHSGEAFLRRVDLEIPGRGFDFRFERIYRSGWLNCRTPLGHNWDFNYNRRIIVVTASNKKEVKERFQDAKPNDVVRMDGEGREDLYVSDEDLNIYISPAGFYTTLTRQGDLFIERDRHGNTITYPAGAVIGGGDDKPITSFTDRNGNTMRFLYNERQLVFVIDTLGRRIQFFYKNNLLDKIRDFIGREIRFRYDATPLLVAVTGPRVKNTPHGNDFPAGKTERYSYESSTDIKPTHRLLTVTAPNEVGLGGPPCEVYKYNDDGRVIEQTYGGTNYTGVPSGGTFKYAYKYQTQTPRIAAIARSLR